ncbi:MAG TPA: glycosyltransferase family 2 protein [Stellaceae bacterium]|nr:glycosyltransferase family 2 protein [Stellaceae bacterium]
MPLVSVIMNCAYGERFLKEAIDSVFAQTHPDWEIVFVDNCSTDGSAAIATAYESTGRLRSVRTSERIPLYAARNVGVENARGEFIAFLDVDDAWKPQMLESLLARMRPGVSFVYGGYRYIDAAGRPLPTPMRRRRRGVVVNPQLWRSLISIGCILLRTDILRAETFDPTFNMLGDFELWLRLGTRHHVCDYVDDTLELSRIHGANGSLVLHDRWIIEERKLYRTFLMQHGLRYPMILAYIAKCEIRRLIGRHRM